MAELYEYPHTGGVTNTFAPSIDADFRESSESMDEGVIAEQSSGKQEYRYEEGIRIKTYKRAYRTLPVADRDSFISFLNVVKGKKFKFTDYAAATHTCTFSEWVTEYKFAEGNKWSWDILFREEL